MAPIFSILVKTEIENNEGKYAVLSVYLRLLFIIHFYYDVRVFRQ